MRYAKQHKIAAAAAVRKHAVGARNHRAGRRPNWMRDWSSGRDAAASATAFKLEFHKTLATSVHASYDTGTTWETYYYKILI